MKRGLLITFEGGEGAGKSTVIAAARTALDRRAVAHLDTREPGGTPFAEGVRALVLDPAHENLCAEAELLAVFAARAQHVWAVIAPALAIGKWVISDRYTDASYAYQGGGRGQPIERIAELERWAAFGLKPDRTFLLDVAVEEGLRRTRARGGTADRMEREDGRFFERVREAYLARAEAEPERIVRLDAGRAPEVVAADVVAEMDRLVERWRAGEA
jgi:dTMP kinase